MSRCPSQVLAGGTGYTSLWTLAGFCLLAEQLEYTIVSLRILDGASFFCETTFVQEPPSLLSWTCRTFPLQYNLDSEYWKQRVLHPVVDMKGFGS